jgi:cysteine desulfurase / selenocysteine lyase
LRRSGGAVEDAAVRMPSARELLPLAPEEDFPVTRDVVYLNTAAAGLVPLPVIAEHDRLARELGRRGVLGYFDNLETFTSAAREAGARLLGCDAALIGLATSVSEANSQIAWWLRPQRGSNIVSTDIESPAVTYPWLRVAEETGAEVRLVPARGDPASLSIEDLAGRVDDRTSVIAISQVEWVTGHRFDLSRLAELAHAHDAIVVVDAAQAAGVVPIDVTASGVDVLVTGAYKWLCSFAGTALCYLGPELAERFRPILVGSGSAPSEPPYDDFDATHLTIAPGVLSLEYGNASHLARASLPLAIDYLLTIGVDRIHRHTLELSARLWDGIARLGGRPITPRADEERAAIVTAAFDGHDAVAVVEELKRRGVHALPRMGHVRFAPHLFNDGDDIERTLEAIADVVRPARRLGSAV